MVTFISDFGPGFHFEQVYPDACDLGLTMVSHRTGNEVRWAIEREYRDHEGELKYWELVPVKGSPASVRGWRLLIFND